MPESGPIRPHAPPSATWYFAGVLLEGGFALGCREPVPDAVDIDGQLGVAGHLSPRDEFHGSTGSVRSGGEAYAEALASAATLDSSVRHRKEWVLIGGSPDDDSYYSEWFDASVSWVALSLSTTINPMAKGTSQKTKKAAPGKKAGGSAGKRVAARPVGPRLLAGGNPQIAKGRRRRPRAGLHRGDAGLETECRAPP